MTQERLDYLLDQHYKDQLSGAERQELDQWFQQMQDVRPGLYTDDKSAGEEEELEEMAESLMLRIDQMEQVNRKAKRRTMIVRWSVAASIAIAIGLAVVFSLSHPGGSGNHTSIASAEDSIRSKQPVVLENNTTEERKYSLPDGTGVTLFANSVLTYDDNYNVKTRDLKLKGKGFFNVKKDAGRPFTVYGNEIATTALGTSFSVSAYENDTIVHVVLKEGRVSVKPVHANDKIVYLDPGYSVSFNTNTLVASAVLPEMKNGVNEIAASKKPSLTAGQKIVFEQQSLQDVLDQLASIYKVPISYKANEISGLDFSGTVKPEDQLMPVLQRIALLNNLSVKSANGKYVITRQ